MIGTAADVAAAAGGSLSPFAEAIFNVGDVFVDSVVIADIPEPSTLVLGIAGVGGLGFVALRKKFRRA